jgi:hypothetical protein
MLIVLQIKKWNVHKSQREIRHVKTMYKVMSVKKLTQKFKDKWILAEVLEEDEYEEPKKLRLIAASKNRDKIYEKQKK